jgi:hypothetical protein
LTTNQLAFRINMYFVSQRTISWIGRIFCLQNKSGRRWTWRWNLLRWFWNSFSIDLGIWDRVRDLIWTVRSISELWDQAQNFTKYSSVELETTRFCSEIKWNGYKFKIRKWLWYTIFLQRKKLKQFTPYDNGRALWEIN